MQTCVFTFRVSSWDSDFVKTHKKARLLQFFGFGSKSSSISCPSPDGGRGGWVGVGIHSVLPHATGLRLTDFRPPQPTEPVTNSCNKACDRQMWQTDSRVKLLTDKASQTVSTYECNTRLVTLNTLPHICLFRKRPIWACPCYSLRVCGHVARVVVDTHVQLRPSSVGRGQAQVALAQRPTWPKSAAEQAPPAQLNGPRPRSPRCLKPARLARLPPLPCREPGCTCASFLALRTGSAQELGGEERLVDDILGRPGVLVILSFTNVQQKAINGLVIQDLQILRPSCSNKLAREADRKKQVSRLTLLRAAASSTSLSLGSGGIKSPQNVAQQNEHVSARSALRFFGCAPRCAT